MEGQGKSSLKGEGFGGKRLAQIRISPILGLKSSQKASYIRLELESKKSHGNPLKLVLVR